MDLVAVPSIHFVIAVIVKSFRVTEAKNIKGALTGL